MCAIRGRVPVYLYILSLILWAIPVTAQQRVPLTIAEAEDLGVANEPGRAAEHLYQVAVGSERRLGREGE